MYEDVKDNEYLDVSKSGLGIDGCIDLFEDLVQDKMLKQVNLSYNITPEEAYNPRRMEHFYRRMKYYLQKNTCLTALDLTGNALFHYHPHPSNEHVVNYEKQITYVLNATKIKRIDLSNNNMAGFSGRELDGLKHFLQNYMVKNEAFSLRSSYLTSQGLRVLTHCLGGYSSLTYLDISDNLAGVDPSGKPDSEGVMHFTKILAQTVKLRTLKIARNHLRDSDCEHICEAVQCMPFFQDLDVSGNIIKYYSCKALREALNSHSIESGPMTGFRELSLSTNPIGDEGIKEICHAIRQATTLKILRVANCGLSELGGQMLQDALAENSTITIVDVYGNMMSEDQESLVVAESEANQYIEEIQADHMAIDADSLFIDMYLALARKLRFLQKEHLEKLHFNPSFNIPGTEMRAALHILEPPPRQFLIQEVKQINSKLEERLEQSRIITKRAKAAKLIHTFCMRIVAKNRQKKNIYLAVLEAQRKERERQMYQEEDDLASYASSLSVKSLKSLKSTTSMKSTKSLR